MSQTIGADVVNLRQHNFVIVTTPPDMQKDDDDANEPRSKSLIPPANTPRNTMGSYNPQAETDKVLKGVMSKLQNTNMSSFK